MTPILQAGYSSYENYDYDKYTAKAVENATNADNRTPEDFEALLIPCCTSLFWNRWHRQATGRN